MLDYDQGVAGLFKNGHKLKDCEGSAYLQVLEPAVKLAEDGSLGEHPIWGYQGVEGPVSVMEVHDPKLGCFWV